MSKIHEALKKAQEERSAALTSVQEQDPREAVLPAEVPVFDPGLLSQEPLMAPALETRRVATVADRKGAGVAPHAGKKFEAANRFEDVLQQCAKPAWSPDPNSIVFSEPSVSLAGAEQFRTLRSRLYTIRETTSLKKILVTSALMGEGKTFVATNLAQAFARERGRRILLVDGDLRSARLHVPLGAPLSPGLSDYLRDEADGFSIIQHGQEGGLFFIAGGNGAAGASELISNGRLQALLDKLAPMFDWVIIDSPPCLPVADAGLLAGMCDGVLLVVRALSTPSEIAQKASRELQKRNVVGVVLNAAEDQTGYGNAYGYGYGTAQQAST